MGSKQDVDERVEVDPVPTQASPPPARPGRITPQDIQQKEFRLAFRGYNERDVDQFLDELTEEVARLYAENRRLGEDVAARGPVGRRSGDAAEAEVALRRARQEAARIVSQAEEQARATLAAAAAAQAEPKPSTSTDASPSPASAARPSPLPEAASSELVGELLSRERRFLQSLAGLIQDHARSVKEELRRSRASGAEMAGPGATVASDRGRISDTDRPRHASTGSSDHASSGSLNAPEGSRGAGRAGATVGGPGAIRPQSGARGRDGPRSAGAAPAAGGGSERTQPWTPTFGAEGEAMSASEAPPSPPADEADVARRRRDRSLRELFWGED